MNVGVAVDFKGTGLDGLVEKVTGPIKRRELNEAMGTGVREKTRDYLRGLAGSRHATATRLGGTPTGFLAQATRAVETAPLDVDSTSATLTINHPGLGRAYHPVTILPKKEFLTIPLNGLAYGHSPREFSKVLLLQQVKAGPKGDKERKPLDNSVPAWLLVRSVTQQQDRSLLPSDQEWQSAAIEAAEAWFQMQLQS